MKREVIIPVCLVVLCIFLFGGSPKKEAENTEYKEIPVRVVTPEYPEEYNNIETIAQKADRIFYGVVTRRNNAFYTGGSNATTGEKIKIMYTPVNFDIKQMIHGEFQNQDNAYYYEMGGTNDTETLEVQGLIPMHPDETVIVFSKNNGNGWGNNSVFHVIKDTVTVENSRLPAGYAANNENGKTVFKVDDFISMIKNCIEE